MNILLFDDADIANANQPERISVRDRRATHVQSILKLSVGSEIRVGKISNGVINETTIGTAEITQIENGVVSFDIRALDQTSPAPSPVELILALPRPKSLKRCLRAAANLGIKSIHLIHSQRVDKSYWSAPSLEPTVMREALIDGLAIARDTQLPIVRLHRLFKPFAQDVAPHLVTTDAFVAHPGGEAALTPITSTSSLIPIAIGPEGGFSPYEVSLFNESGFKNLSLGRRVYSVECAVPVIDASIRGKINEAMLMTGASDFN